MTINLWFYFIFIGFIFLGFIISNQLKESTKSIILPILVMAVSAISAWTIIFFNSTVK